MDVHVTIPVSTADQVSRLMAHPEIQIIRIVAEEDKPRAVDALVRNVDAEHLRNEGFDVRVVATLNQLEDLAKQVSQGDRYAARLAAARRRAGR